MAHAINIRKIDDGIYREIKSEAKKKKLSINKLLLEILEMNFDKNLKIREYDDLDSFFGTWTEEEYRRVCKSVEKHRQIDAELWK